MVEHEQTVLSFTQQHQSALTLAEAFCAQKKGGMGFL